MDEESEPKPAAVAAAEEEEGGGPPPDATPPPSSSSSSASQQQQQQTTAAQAPAEEEEEEALGEAVPMATGDGEAKDGGGGGEEDKDDDVVMLVGEEEEEEEEEASRTTTTTTSNQDTPDGGSTDCTQQPPSSSSTPTAAAATTATGGAVTTTTPVVAAASKTPSSSSSSSSSSPPASSSTPPPPPSSSLSPAAPKAATTTTTATTEPIVIDDEEDIAATEHKDSSSSSPAAAPPGVGAAVPPPPSLSSSSPSSSSSHAAASAVTLSSTEPDSEIRIASVTTLESNNRQKQASSSSSSSSVFATATAEPQVDMNLKITSVTSLQGGASAIVAGAEGQVEENGLQISGGTFGPTDLQISGAFSLNADSSSPSSSRPTASFNPGRVSSSTNAAGQPVQNGDTGTHARTDSWISQSASFPRNQKQTGVDSPSPATSLTKPPGQSPSSSSSSGSQQQPRTVKVTCANCKKPLKKGQTAYQRKGSTHLFCSTTCLSAFSHKPAPKKSCTMCKKDITTMKGTIVAQVDSSEQFQEFCSTGCLGAYENKQNPPKSTVKTKCTVCGKLTEIRHEVSFKTVTHKICSDNCFNRYRMANGLIMNCCEQCGDYLPSRATANHFVLVDGQQKRFCCQNCIRDFKQAHSKLASCVTCKTLIKTGDVLHSLGAGGTMASYCSVACMNKAKMPAVVVTPTTQNAEPTCHYCKTKSLPQYQATLPEGNVLNFCSSQCVAKFQNAPTLQTTTTTNGQTPLPTTNSSVQLKCNYCKGAFSLKPETLDWEDKVHQFCSKTCCEDYKKLHCIVTFCEYCQEEKTLHETVQISGVKRPFCSEGCKLLFKQDFVRRLGLKCVSCNHCNQLCKRGVTRQLGGMTRDFCSEACAKKFNDWYYKALRCDCCKVQGALTESVQWRTEMKHFCDQQCLLRFYCQQNEPIMVTQKGPENTSLGFDMPSAKLGVVNQGTGPSAGGSPGGKDVKNKAVLCKPLTLTKATYCKPHMQSKLLQTDVDDGVKREYIPVPIPVPVFIPVPMSMYSQLTPSLFPMPLPVPVPVLLPTTLRGAEQIVECIGDLKSKASSSSDDATAVVDQAITEEQKPDVKPVMKVKRERGGERRGEGESSCSTGSSSEEEEEEEEDKYEPDLDLEMDFPQAPALDSILALEDDMGFSLPPVLAEEKEEPLSRPQPRRKGHKRRAVEGETVQSSSPSSSSCPSDRRAGEGERRGVSLQARYGLNAWKRWAMSSSSPPAGQSDVTKEGKKDGPPDAAAATRSNSNMLSLSPAELSAALSRFVREACRPGGDHYAPDSILYLCLGIQQHLRAKGRKDDLFSDPCYQKFGEELNKILKDWKPTVLPDGCLWGRVEEGSLWSSGHLGEQSPAALLRSLVYLNTKYFGLRTADQHLRLSFANVYGPDTVHPATKEAGVCIRVPSIAQEHSLQRNSRKRKRKGEEEDEPDYEPDEGSGTSTTHCPVKKHECRLYELYRSKCPSSLRERVDMFYMQPEASHGPDSPLWFTSSPLERGALESLLARVLLAREIYAETPHPEEEEEEQGGEEGEEGSPGGGE